MTATKRRVLEDIGWANERLAQVGVYIDIDPDDDIVIVDPPAGVDLTNDDKLGLLGEDRVNISLPPTVELKALLDALGTVALNDTVVIYANELTNPELYGFTTARSVFSGPFFGGPHPDKYYFNAIVGADNANSSVLGHELLHAMLDSGHTGDTSQYLFHAAMLSPFDVNKVRRISVAQEATILASDLVDDPV